MCCAQFAICDSHSASASVRFSQYELEKKKQKKHTNSLYNGVQSKIQPKR